MNYEEDNRIAPAQDYDDEPVTAENCHVFRDDEKELSVSQSSLSLLFGF